MRFRIALLVVLMTSVAAGETPLHQKIDDLVLGKGKPRATRCDDATFLRRVSLDLIGRIPSPAEIDRFASLPAATRRQQWVDHLLGSDEHPRHMKQWFHVLLMERRGDDAEWLGFLQRSFQANKPWDELVRDILDPNPETEARKGAAFFYTKRLTKVGQQPTDFPGLTRDVGRLFLGQDLQCAQCHDHLFISDYKQSDFQGLYTVFSSLAIRTDLKFPAVKEKKISMEQQFVSVFDPTQQMTPPKVPQGDKATIPDPPPQPDKAKKKKKPKKPADEPGLSGTQWISTALPKKSNSLFCRNIANRIWHHLIGRGLVHPLDLHHSENPPSHPKLLELLGASIAAHDFDLRWLIREIVLSETYQLDSESGDQIPSETFRIAHQRRLSAEQLLDSVLEALGERKAWPKIDPTDATKAEAAKDSKAKGKSELPAYDELRKAFVEAFANVEKEPEQEISSTVKGSLFLLNSDVVAQLLQPRPGNLLQRLQDLEDSAMIDEMFLCILSRKPTAEEQKELVRFVQKSKERPRAIRDAVWALFSSIEFYVNH